MPLSHADRHAGRGMGMVHSVTTYCLSLVTCNDDMFLNSVASNYCFSVQSQTDRKNNSRQHLMTQKPNAYHNISS